MWKVMLVVGCLEIPSVDKDRRHYGQNNAQPISNSPRQRRWKTSTRLAHVFPTGVKRTMYQTSRTRSGINEIPCHLTAEAEELLWGPLKACDRRNVSTNRGSWLEPQAVALLAEILMHKKEYVTGAEIRTKAFLTWKSVFESAKSARAATANVTVAVRRPKWVSKVRLILYYQGWWDIGNANRSSDWWDLGGREDIESSLQRSRGPLCVIQGIMIERATWAVEEDVQTHVLLSRDGFERRSLYYCLLSFWFISGVSIIFVCSSRIYLRIFVIYRWTDQRWRI